MNRRVITFIAYGTIFFLFWLNAEWLVNWLNRSLFEEFEMFQLEHEPSFTKGASFIFLFFILAYAVFGNVWLALIVPNSLFLIIAYANQVKVMTRNEYITYRELLTFTSPKEILMLVDLSIERAAWIGLCLFVVLFSIQWFSMKCNRAWNRTYHRWVRLVLGTVSLSLLIWIMNDPHTYNEKVLKYEPLVGNNFNPVYYARYKGYVPTVLHTMDITYLDRPAHYNKKTMEQIVEKYSKRAEKINQTRTQSVANTQTIFYLSETLIAPHRIPRFETGEPILPHMETLMNQVVTGDMYTQYIGGGTANIEWSVLTSFSLEALNNHYSVTPYSDFYTTVPNHASVLRFFEGPKIAIHPYTAGLYKRTSVFEKMGFDDFLYVDHGLTYEEKFEGHDYIHDRAMHQELIDALRAGTRFIHAISMQNHSNYHYSYPFLRYEPQFWRAPFGERATEVENYLKGLRMTDEAFPELLEAIEQLPEDVNVLVYGDHFPNMFNGKDEAFEKEVLHRTPWFLYMNHGRNESKTIPEVSPIFFTTIVLQEGNYYVSPFQALLTQLYEAGVQRIGRDYIVQHDRMMERGEWDDKIDSLLTDYFLIMYDALLGSHYATDLFFEEWNA